MGIIASFLGACAGEPPTNLGVHDGRLAFCPSSPNCVSSQASDDVHRIDPLRFAAGDADVAFLHLKEVLSARKDAKIVDDGRDYLRVELRTTLFVDDVEFLLDRENNLIHLRSASRRGYSDLGKNRKRIEEIRKVFNVARKQSTTSQKGE